MPRAGPGNQPTQKRLTMACKFIMSSCPPLYADMTMKTPRNCSAAHLKSRRNRLLLSRITFDHGPCPSSHASCRARRNLPPQNCDNSTNASCGARESALQGGISSCRSGGDGGGLGVLYGLRETYEDASKLTARRVLGPTPNTLGRHVLTAMPTNRPFRTLEC